MVLKHGGKLVKTAQDKWILYISKKLVDDSQWPFPEGTQEVMVDINPFGRSLLIRKVGEKNSNDKTDA